MTARPRPRRGRGGGSESGRVGRAPLKRRVAATVQGSCLSGGGPTESSLQLLKICLPARGDFGPTTTGREVTRRVRRRNIIRSGSSPVGLQTVERGPLLGPARIFRGAGKLIRLIRTVTEVIVKGSGHRTIPSDSDGKRAIFTFPPTSSSCFSLVSGLCAEGRGGSGRR